MIEGSVTDYLLFNLRQVFDAQHTARMRYKGFASPILLTSALNAAVIGSGMVHCGGNNAVHSESGPAPLALSCGDPQTGVSAQVAVTDNKFSLMAWGSNWTAEGSWTALETWTVQGGSGQGTLAIPSYTLWQIFDGELYNDQLPAGASLGVSINGTSAGHGSTEECCGPYLDVPVPFVFGVPLTISFGISGYAYGAGPYPRSGGVPPEIDGGGGWVGYSGPPQGGRTYPSTSGSEPWVSVYQNGIRMTGATVLRDMYTPEPSTVLLIASGTLMVVVAARSRRAFRSGTHSRWINNAENDCCFNAPIVKP